MQIQQTKHPSAQYTPSVHSLPVQANISLYTISMESSTYPREETDSTVCHCHQYKLTSLRLYARSTTLASTEPKLNAPSACTTAHISSDQALRTKTHTPQQQPSARYKNHTSKCGDKPSHYDYRTQSHTQGRLQCPVHSKRTHPTSAG